MRITELEEKIRVMDERLALLERRLNDTARASAVAGIVPAAATPSQVVPATYTLPAAAPAAPAPAQASSVAGGAANVSARPEGFSIQSPEGDFRLGIQYQMHVDGRFTVDRNSETAPNSFYLRRTQAILDGILYERFHARFLSDFSDGRARVNDAYIDASVTPWLSVRTGKFKAPVGLERLRSGMTLPLMERALPTQLVPNREIGVQFSGDVASSTVSYALGVFDGALDGSNTDGNTGDQKVFHGRLMTQPFANSSARHLSGLVFGLGGSYGAFEGSSEMTNLPGYESTGGREFFRYRNDGTVADTTVADGTLYRLSPQGYYYAGPFGVMAEYVQSAQEVRRGGATAMMNHSSWQLVTSYVLTGDDGTYAGVTPDRPFDPSLGNWGALEIAARYTELNPDGEAFPVFADPGEAASEAKAWSLGLTWYLNRNIKLVFGYERTKFESAVPEVTFDTENLFLQRFQLRF
jgi:phosphate-selective porin OprO/OprP